MPQQLPSTHDRELVGDLLPDGRVANYRMQNMGLRQKLRNRVGQVAMPVVAGLAAAPLGPAGGIWCACLILASSGTERLVSGRKR